MQQVGIGVKSPTETLDIDGTIRIREIEETTDINYVLVIDNDGNTYKSDIKNFKSATEELTIKNLAKGASSTITNHTNIAEAKIIITSANDCNRQMISSFISYGNSLAFLNGVARTEIPTVSTTLGSYSVICSLKFNTFSYSGIDGNMFDFSFEKTNAFT